MKIKFQQIVALIVVCTFVQINVAYSQTFKGLASYYANKFEGRRCSSGEIFRQDSMTCAHKTLPFGTLLKVCNSKEKCVVVKVNDRLPKKSKRTVDLTLRAAKELNLYYAGIMKVTIEVVGKDSIYYKKNTTHTVKKTKRKKK